MCIMYISHTRVGQVETEIFRNLAHSLNGNNGWGWAKLQLGAPDFLRVFRVVGRGQGTWVIFRCSPRHISRELD